MAATLADLEADLTEVQTCISRILGANTQEHWTGGSDRHRSPELNRLFDERRRLRDEIACLDGGSAAMQRIQVID